MGLSKDELLERCNQLNHDCEVAIEIAEIYKKDLEEISKNTWQNIVTILKKGLKKDQTPDQAYAELIATGLSKEVLQNIKAGTAGLDFVEKVESWFSTVVGKPAEGTGMMFICIGIGVYVKFFSKPGLDTARSARAATEIADETLKAFEKRMGNISHLLGSNIAAQGVQGQIMLSNNELEAARQKVLAVERAANERDGTQFAKFGLAGGLGVLISNAIFENAAEKDVTDEIKRSLHWIYTSRFYMTVQQKYLEFLVHHVRQIEIYAAFIAKGTANVGPTILESMASHTIELDPKTNTVNVESIKPFSWSEEAVAADLAKLDKDKGRKMADDPTKEEMEWIHREQLYEIGWIMANMKKEAEDKARGAAKSN